jgi:AIPR protein
VKTTLQDLRQQVDDLGTRYTKLPDDALFVAWYLTAMLVDDEKVAVESTIGGAGDKSVDGVYVDDDIRCVFVVQAKYRQKLKAASEGRSDVLAFASLTEALFGPGPAFQAYREKADALVADRMKAARDRIQKRGYRLQLHYVTLGKCSAPLRKEAESLVKRDSGRRADFLLFDGDEVLQVLDDYLDGVAPPVPSLDLPFEVSGAINRFDPTTKIDSWVFTMRGRDVGELYKRSGIRLFARNVRGFLGDTDINSAMHHTLEAEPEYFWYFNNGVTIVCDDAEKIQKKGREVLQVQNPQVINGQQTTRVLAEVSKSPTASVLVRVIQIPRGDDRAVERFEILVSRIVQATNWQNAIRASDLMSNDRQQVAIEREFRKAGYQYLRKRQTKGEARRAARSQYRFLAKKEELAQAVAACLLDPQIVRRGKEHLFDEAYYKTVFPNSDADFYLGKYWLLREVTSVSRGYPERAYAKWIVMHFLWSQIGDIIDSRPVAFRRACEQKWKNPALFDQLDRAVASAFKVALQLYRRERGTGPTALDVSTYFNRREVHIAFKKHWIGPDNKQRPTFERAVAKFQEALKEV